MSANEFIIAYFDSFSYIQNNIDKKLTYITDTSRRIQSFKDKIEQLSNNEQINDYGISRESYIKFRTATGTNFSNLAEKYSFEVSINGQSKEGTGNPLLGGSPIYESNGDSENPNWTFDRDFKFPIESPNDTINITITSDEKIIGEGAINLSDI